MASWYCGLTWLSGWPVLRMWLAAWNSSVAHAWLSLCPRERREKKKKKCSNERRENLIFSENTNPREEKAVWRGWLSHRRANLREKLISWKLSGNEGSTERKTMWKYEWRGSNIEERRNEVSISKEKHNEEGWLQRKSLLNENHWHAENDSRERLTKLGWNEENDSMYYEGKKLNLRKWLNLSIWNTSVLERLRREGISRSLRENRSAENVKESRSIRREDSRRRSSSSCGERKRRSCWKWKICQYQNIRRKLILSIDDDRREIWALKKWRIWREICQWREEETGNEGSINAICENRKKKIESKGACENKARRKPERRNTENMAWKYSTIRRKYRRKSWRKYEGDLLKASEMYRKYSEMTSVIMKVEVWHDISIVVMAYLEERRRPAWKCGRKRSMREEENEGMKKAQEEGWRKRHAPSKKISEEAQKKITSRKYIEENCEHRKEKA